MIQKIKYFLSDLGAGLFMLAWEVQKRLSGKWRRSALRERLNQWRARK